ncbi:MAG: OB-fold nucleic acid binding domain-containing protein, partial [bacterium]|nr:OB-fold nucleic acid binding domain-containing protein [bacterium]
MKQKLIKELKPGDNVIAYFILRKKEIRQKKSSDDSYLALEFGDQSGRIQGTLWEGIDKINDQLRPCELVKIKGKVISFQNKPHITVEKIRCVNDGENVNVSDFLPVTANDVEAMFNELTTILQSVNTPPLQALLSAFLNNETFVADFKRSPGGKLWHHAYVGGLLEHTLSVVKITNALAQHFGDFVNRDLLVSAAFFHDIGKIDEFSVS